jgi:hypothetical protein
MLHSTSGLDKSFAVTYETENGQEIMTEEDIFG